MGVEGEGHCPAAPDRDWKRKRAVMLRAGTSWKLVAGGGARLEAGSGRRCRADPEEERYLRGAPRPGEREGEGGSERLGGREGLPGGRWPGRAWAGKGKQRGAGRSCRGGGRAGGCQA